MKIPAGGVRRRIRGVYTTETNSVVGLPILVITLKSGYITVVDEIGKHIDITEWLDVDHDKIMQKFNVCAIPFKSEGKLLLHCNRELWYRRAAGVYAHDDTNRSISTVFDTYRVSSDDMRTVKIDKSFERSRWTAYFWETKLLTKFTTTDLARLLVERNLHKYRYNGAGSGCRTWAVKLVKLLEEEGIVVEEASADLRYWVPDEDGAEFFDDDDD
ncbi:hypothetical protein EV360DRAFT_74347 [Lentinula raphanica]|nr:hypothetical protein EV360DRAFT_74347 [Lentinula raphanica]